MDQIWVDFNMNQKQKLFEINKIEIGIFKIINNRYCNKSDSGILLTVLSGLQILFLIFLCFLNTKEFRLLIIRNDFCGHLN